MSNAPSMTLEKDHNYKGVTIGYLVSIRGKKQLKSLVSTDLDKSLFKYGGLGSMS